MEYIKLFYVLFLFNPAASFEIYTLSLHDALPISYFVVSEALANAGKHSHASEVRLGAWEEQGVDRKSTRLNSSHVKISYAVFCLKKKKQTSANTQHAPMLHTIVRWSRSDVRITLV